MRPYRGNMGRYSRGGWRHSDRAQAVPLTPAPPTGQLIERITTSDLTADGRRYETVASISNSQVIASFNWLDKTTPTIAIPGKPPRWAPPATPEKLPQDSGIYYRDINSAQYAKHPMEPAIVAGLTIDPSFPKDVEIVACGSTLGNLLRFISGENRPFRILVEEVDGTVFFVRRENSPKETIPKVRGHGHTFPEAYTTWEPEVRGSVSSQRLLRYKLGGFDCAVRSEIDGYFGAQGSGVSPPTGTGAKANTASASLDGLVNSLASNRISPSQATAAADTLTTTSAGEIVAQKHVFDLKTRWQGKKGIEDTLATELARLWVRQIPNFVLAYHDEGLFGEIQIKDVRSNIEQWEKDHKEELGRLIALLHRILGAVRARPDLKMEICFTGTGDVLEFRTQLPGVGDVMSPKTKALWGAGRNAGMNFKKDEGGAMGWEDDKADYTACTTDCGYCGKCAGGEA